MGWFQEMCHNVGLMIHNVQHPDPLSESRIVRKTTETEKRGSVTLRKTTIEEIQVNKTDADDRDQKSTDTNDNSNTSI